MHRSYEFGRGAAPAHSFCNGQCGDALANNIRDQVFSRLPFDSLGKAKPFPLVGFQAFQFIESGVATDGKT